MTLKGQIAHPLDKAAIREPFLNRQIVEADFGAAAAIVRFVRSADVLVTVDWAQTGGRNWLWVLEGGRVR